MTAREVAFLLGVSCPKVVASWEARGMLRGRRGCLQDRPGVNL